MNSRSTSLCEGKPINFCSKHTTSGQDFVTIFIRMSSARLVPAPALGR